MPTSAPLLLLTQLTGGGEKAGPELIYAVLAVSAVLQSLALGLLWKLVRSSRARAGRPLHS